MKLEVSAPRSAAPVFVEDDLHNLATTTSGPEQSIFGTPARGGGSPWQGTGPVRQPSQFGSSGGPGAGAFGFPGLGARRPHPPGDLAAGHQGGDMTQRIATTPQLRRWTTPVTTSALLTNFGPSALSALARAVWAIDEHLGSDSRRPC